MGAVACTYADLPAGADVVLVSTPPASHVNDAIQALQGGAAAIIEKPIATKLSDADRLVEASDASGGRVGYAENLAFAPVFREAFRRKAALGPIHHLELRVIQSRPDWGDFLTADWGGGVLFDLGVHPLAIALLLAAPARPVEVSAHLEGADDIEVDDFAELTLSFDSGLHAQLRVSWRANDDDRIWDLQAASATGVMRIELGPSFGMEIDGEPIDLAPVREGLPSPLLEQMGYIDQLESFIGDFDAGRTPEMGAEFGRQVLDIICAAYQSRALEIAPHCNSGAARPSPAVPRFPHDFPRRSTIRDSSHECSYSCGIQRFGGDEGLAHETSAKT